MIGNFICTVYILRPNHACIIMAICVIIPLYLYFTLHGAIYTHIARKHIAKYDMSE